jgi:hypothetical protein
MRTVLVSAIACVLACAFGAAQAQGAAVPAGRTARAAVVKPAGGAAGTTHSAASSAAPGLRGLENATRRADGAMVINGTLSGNGTVAGNGTRVFTGKVAPGNSPGCVSDQGNVVFEGGASLEIEIGGITPCTQFDQYSVALTLTLNGPTLNVLLINGFVPASGQRFRFLIWGTLVGNFGRVNLPALPSGLSWDTTRLYTSGELAVVGPNGLNDGEAPLPAWSLGLLGAGLLAVLARRRR